MKAKTTAVLFGLMMGASVVAAQAATIIDNTTQGNYNIAIGTSLNGTNQVGGIGTAYMFPYDHNNVGTNPGQNPPGQGDPSLIVNTEPDLTAAAFALGDWLTNPLLPGGLWGGVQDIPATWAINTETAIIYKFSGALQNVVATFGIDNGIFLWLDGVFVGGRLDSGGTFPGEYEFILGDLAAGDHFLQVLREDHGGEAGYSIQMTGTSDAGPVVPIPGALLLLLSGLTGLGFLGRARSKAI